jgi:hypothetical protein
MSMFKTLFGIERKIFNLAKEGADLAMKSPTSAQIEAYWQKVRKLGESVDTDALHEAKSQVEARLKKYMWSMPWMSATQIETQLNRYWGHIFNASEAAQGVRIQKWVNRKPYWKALKIGIGVAFGGWFVIGMINTPSVTIPSIQQQTISDIQKHVNDFHEANESITLSTSEFENMFDAIEAPAPVDEPPLPAAALAPAVAAIEAEPVTIEMATPQGTRQITSTVGRVYRNATPEVREQMEAPKIDHGYDHPDPNDCFVKHCLTSHKDFSVTADFDTGGKQTAHLRY